MMTVRAVEKGTGRVRTGRIGGGSGSGGGVTPAFQADFTSLSALPTGVSFSRATAGTYFDAAGVLQTAAINAARFDHTWNGSAWVASGLLIEEQRTNLLLSSNAFNSADWTVAGGSSVAKNAVGPDGVANSAWTWTSASGSGNNLYQSVDVAAGSTWSVYIKTGSGDPWFSIEAYDGLRRRTFFHPATGTIGTVNDGGGSTSLTQSNPVFTPLANGWYRASITNNGNATSFFIFNMSDTVSAVDTVTGIKTLMLANAQAELGQVATSYIPTTTAAVTRSADIAQLTGAALAAIQGTAGSAIVQAANLHPAGAGAQLLSGGSIQMLSVSADGVTWQYYNGTADIVTSPANDIRAGAVRSAVAWDTVGRSAFATGASAVGTDTTPDPSHVTSWSLGSRPDGADNFANGPIQAIAIYSSRLSNADLQTKSVVGAAF